MPDGKRLWRTETGGLVEDGHPAALVLAYGVDDEMTPEDAAPAKPKAEKPSAHTSKATARTSKHSDK